MHDRFDAFEAVFPRCDQPQRRAVLRRQGFAVHADGQQRQRVHRLVQPQPFDVGVLQAATDKAIFLAGHLLRIVQRLEGHVARVAVRLGQLEKLAQFEADPRHHHRPGLDAAHAVNALFQRETLHQIVDIQRYRLRHFAVDAHLPAFGFQPAGVGGRIGFVEAEFIEVVVAGDLVFRRHCQLRLPRPAC